MLAQRFAVFDSPVGRCAIAWTDRGIASVFLPEQDEVRLRERIARRLPDAREAPPSPEVANAIAAILTLLGGGKPDLASIVLDMHDLPPFERRVYAAARAIPPGATQTYGEIASRIREPGAARAVGRALGRNPFPIIVPCHRVLGAGGKLGGFSAPGGIATKTRLLLIEGATSPDAPALFDSLPLAAPPSRRRVATRPASVAGGSRG